jgi:hypothetical protein
MLWRDRVYENAEEFFMKKNDFSLLGMLATVPVFGFMLSADALIWRG